MQQNQIGARMIYDNARAKTGNQGRTTQSFLRLEQAIAVGKTLYQFPCLVNETQLGVFNTEQRLNQQDAFIISTCAVLLGAPVSATDAAYKLNTFPNGAEAFTTALSAAAAMAIYNGKLSIAVNNNKLLPSLDVYRHYKVPQQQLTAAVNSAATQLDGAEDGFYPIEPNITLVGNLNNVIQIELPAGVTTIHPFSRIVVFLRGILQQAA